jgi:hypothetical protein
MSDDLSIAARSLRHLAEDASGEIAALRLEVERLQRENAQLVSTAAWVRKRSIEEADEIVKGAASRFIGENSYATAGAEHICMLIREQFEAALSAGDGT